MILGEITLAWGKEGSAKSDGYGLAKIAKYHPEVLDNLTEIVEKTPITKQTPNRYTLETDKHFLAIRREFDGKKEKWLLTAFEKDESATKRRTDLPSTPKGEAKKTTSANTHNDNSTKNTPKKTRFYPKSTLYPRVNQQKKGVKMIENCPYCGYEMHDNGQDCPHPLIMKNEFCCPNCDVHFDSGLNEVPIDDLGIARPPSLSDKEYIPPEPLPEPTPPSQDSSTKPTTPAKPKIDSIYAPPPSKNIPSQKVLKEIESLQDYLKSAS